MGRKEFAARTNLSSLDFFDMEILSFEIGNDIFEIENGFSSQLADLIQVLKNNLEK